MKTFILIASLLISSFVCAKPIPGLNDYGELLNTNRFSEYCAINDPGISGLPTINIYTNKQVNCKIMQKLVNNTYVQAQKYLSTINYNLYNKAPKILTIRVLTLAELNNPENFSFTDKRCMSNISCNSGAYIGRTFYAPESEYINLYVVYANYIGEYSQYSFVPNLKHELMHAILYRYGLNYHMSEKKEHTIIHKFLHWIKNSE